MENKFVNIVLEGDVDQWIHVGVGFDRNYLMPFHAMLNSLIESNRDNKLQLHVIADELSSEEKKEISDRLRAAGNRISFYNVDSSLINKFVLTSQWTAVVYYRLFFSKVIPQTINRLLYLDCDTIVNNSLLELYSMDLEGHPVAAVYDNYVRIQPLIGIVQEGEYFNSGVLLMDIHKWNQQQVSERALDYLLTYPEKIVFVDQCALNAVLRNNWKKLDPCFNLMYSLLPEGLSKRHLNDYLNKAVIIHFTLQRPWQMLCRNRLRYLYFFHLRRSRLKLYPFYCYSDFEWKKIPAWLKLRTRELYFDMPVIQKIWRSRLAK